MLNASAEFLQICQANTASCSTATKRCFLVRFYDYCLRRKFVPTRYGRKCKTGKAGHTYISCELRNVDDISFKVRSRVDSLNSYKATRCMSLFTFENEVNRNFPIIICDRGYVMCKTWTVFKTVGTRDELYEVIERSACCIILAYLKFNSLYSHYILFHANFCRTL